MHRNQDVQKKILHRLKIAKGHLEKVIKMSENQEYCIDVLHQLQAVEKALKATEEAILDNHLKTCVVEQLKEGKEEAVEEIMQVFKKV